MLPPRISTIEALLVILIGLYCCWLAYVIYKNRNKSDYPNTLASLILVGIGFWLFIAAYDDRVSDRGINLIFSRIGYELPLLIIYLFSYFSFEFPPASDKRISKFVLWFQGGVALIVSALIFHPSDLVIYSSELIGADIHIGWPFIVTICAYALFLTVGVISLVLKAKRSREREKSSIYYILTGFSLTTLIAMSVAIKMALSGSTPYLYQYAYYATIFFAVALSYAILKNSALKTTISFRRTIVIAAILLVFSFGYGLFSGIERLLYIDTLRLSIITSVLSVSLVLVLNYWFSSRENRLADRVARGNQLDRIRSKYGITWLYWTYNNVSRRSGQIPNSFRPYKVKNAIEICVADISRLTARRLQVAPVFNVSPDRAALVISTKYGVFYAGRRTFNLIFSETDIKNFSYEVHIYAIEQETLRLQKEAKLQELNILDTASQKYEKLVQANELLKRKLKDRAVFFKSIAITVRTPLTLLISAVQDGAQKTAPPVYRSITTNAKRLLELTSELQQEPEKRDLLGKATPIDLLQFVHETKEKHAPAAKKKKVKLGIEARGTEPVIGVRKIHLSQIVDNLLDNAIKYTEPGSQIHFFCSSSNDGLTIVVSDNGQGIPESDRELIFEPFYRARIHDHLPGSGLGLSAIRDIAKLYNGNISYRPNSPSGSIFTLRMAKRKI